VGTSHENIWPQLRIGAVKVGAAEGDTCGPRALRAPVTNLDTMDEVGPSGPAWMRRVRFPGWKSTGAVTRESVRRDGGVGLPTLVELCVSVS
jgi:hypothetical protein